MVSYNHKLRVISMTIWNVILHRPCIDEPWMIALVGVKWTLRLLCSSWSLLSTTSSLTRRITKDTWMLLKVSWVTMRMKGWTSRSCTGLTARNSSSVMLMHYRGLHCPVHLICDALQMSEHTMCRYFRISWCTTHTQPDILSNTLCLIMG